MESLEAEKANLLSDIAFLKERIARYERSKSSDALESEVEMLRTEKAMLEEEAASYDEEPGFEIPLSALARLESQCSEP